MRKLIFHSYHFPPIGGSGAQRPLKMVRALAQLGYESTVVTGGGATTDRWAPEDATLSAEIPPEVTVRRVPRAGEPDLSAGLRHRAERWLGLRDRWGDWWADASYRLGKEVGAEADLIYVWMQPYASAEAGVALSSALKLPWVADLGDPWALDEMMIYPTAIHRRRELRRMGRLLETASAIVMSTPEAVLRLMAAFPQLESKIVTAIPNGFDAVDFAGSAEPRHDRRFRIVHTGYLHTALGREHRRRGALRRVLGGSVRGVDILTRSHVYLIEALDHLLARDPSLKDVLELHLAGVLSDVDRAVAEACPLVRVHGYLSHAESIELMRTAELLFLPLQNLPDGTRATVVPGKTYDYLAAGTPILGAVPEGDLRDILREAGHATLVRPDDVEGMASAILRELERFRSGKRAPAPDPAVVGRFEYRKLAADLAAVFDAVLEDRPALKQAERTSRSAR